MSSPFYRFLRQAPLLALLSVAVLLGALGALGIWLGLDEGSPVALRVGAVLAGMGLAALLLALLRGLLTGWRRLRAIDRRARERSRAWRLLLRSVAVLLVLAGALAAHNYVLTFLEPLELSQNPIGDAGVLALARSPRARSLTALYLSEVGMTDQGARALAQSPNLRRLRTLDVDGNRLTPAGVQALRQSPGLKGCAIDFGTGAKRPAAG